MAAAFFTKLTPRIPVALSSGAFVKFEPADPNLGTLKTEDPAVIAGLTAMVGSGKGGVAQVTEEEYLEILKKKSIRENTFKPRSVIDEVQTSGLITVVVPLPQSPRTPPSPIPSSPAVPVVNANPPLTEPPPIKLGKSK